MQRIMVWETNSGNEWFYIGDRESMDTDVLQAFIDERFSENSLYLVDGRSSSCQIVKVDASIEIKSRISNQNIILCDLDFSLMLEVNKIGVARYGSIGIPPVSWTPQLSDNAPRGASWPNVKPVENVELSMPSTSNKY